MEDYNIQVVYTDNPYMDVLIYNTKVLAMGSVIKNQTDADKYETVDIIKESDLYLACVQGRQYFELFLPYPDWVIMVSTIPDSIKRECILDNNLIPESKRQEVTNIMAAHILSTYEEKNEYYRRLNGLPPIGEEYIYLTEDLIPEDIVLTADINTTPIHELPDSDAEILYIFNIIDKLKEKYPNARYLDFLGSKRISIYRARTAINFELLYVPSCDVPDIRTQYIDLYNKNMDFTKRTIYSEAFKFQSDYYDSFISLFIAIQTMVDIFTSLQIAILNKEIFDSRTLRYLFESYGIPYYSEIPIKYQVAMIKNIHTLLKYKSTNKNIVDICSLFGFDDIQIFKYYILKDVTVTKDEIEDKIETTSELKFIKVPLQESVDDYLKDEENYLSYDSITSQDEFWDGDQDHEYIRDKIMEIEFSYLRTKFMSVDVLCDISEIAFDVCYFFNFIFDNIPTEERLTLAVPYIKQGKTFKMVDLFCMLLALMFKYNNVEDTIMDCQEKVLYIKGFNFNADLAALAEYLADNHLSAELAGIAGFTVPESSILTYKQLLQIFMDNKAVYKHITDRIINADNKRIYDIYKNLYDSLMIMQYTNTYFKLPNGEVAKTYTEFIKYRDIVLYAELQKIDNLSYDEEKRKDFIMYLTDIIITELDRYVTSDVISNIYHYFPSENKEYIEKFLLKVINFFKSYKTQMLNMTIIYKIDDKFENLIRAIDGPESFISTFDLDQIINTIEKIYIDSYSIRDDRVQMLDKIMIEISRMIEKKFSDNFEIVEQISNLISKQLVERLHIKDDIHLASTIDMIDNISLRFKRAISSILNYNTKIEYVDSIADRSSTYDIHDRYDIICELYESLNTVIYGDLYSPNDIYISTVKSKKDDRLTILDKVSIEPKFD